MSDSLIHRASGWLSLLNQAGVQVLFWFVVLHLTQRHHLSAWTVALDAVLLLWGLVGLAAMALAGVRLPRLIFGLLSTLSLLLATFSWFYWEYGTTPNFSQPLTHLDSTYFALGTLTTAGTGTFVAKGETAIALQSAQMALNLILTLFVIGVVVARFVPLRRPPIAAPHPKASSNPPPGSAP